MTALARVSNGSSPMLSGWVEDWFNTDSSSLMNGFSNGKPLPAVNIKETPDAFLVEVAAPGMKKSDFHINLDNQLLTISSESRMENKEEDVSLVRREFNYTSFKRVFTLPDTVNSDKVSAKYTEGILQLSLPKKEEARKKPARMIPIK